MCFKEDFFGINKIGGCVISAVLRVIRKRFLLVVGKCLLRVIDETDFSNSDPCAIIFPDFYILRLHYSKW